MDKQRIRERVWDDLEERGVARFPFPPHGRIPNVAGAADTADRLAGLEEWRSADTLKANPDAPQLPARRRALREGTTVYMAVPRLRDPECFVELAPDRIDDLDAAATVSAMDDHGVRVGPDEVAPIDLILVGSVAVTESGARIGKGEGYSDLEYAVLRELELVDEATPVATTVHERQVVDEAFPVAPHDVPMDVIATPDRVIRTDATHDRPDGIDWGRLSAERREEIPVLDRFGP